MPADVLLHEGGELSVKGSITIDNVVSIAARGVALFDRDRGHLVIDLAQITEVDSSAVSLLLEWQREAAARNRKIRFSNMPQSLQNLVRLYGVYELMDFA